MDTRWTFTLWSVLQNSGLQSSMLLFQEEGISSLSTQEN